MIIHFLVKEQILALLCLLLPKSASGMLRHELPLRLRELPAAPGNSKLFGAPPDPPPSRLITSCKVCHFWMYSFWCFITSSQCSLPVPRANMAPPKTVNPRGLSVRYNMFKSKVFILYNKKQCCHIVRDQE